MHDPRHPLAFGDLRSWFRLLREGGGVDPTFRDRAAFITRTSLQLLPLRLYERARCLGVGRQPLPAPIFVVGHWRSGTTHLHNLLTLDRTWGYVTLFQALVPHAFFVGQGDLKRQIASTLPHHRHMDNMELLIDGPQEEEIAMQNSSHCSPYFQWVFPRRARFFLGRYGLLHNAPPSVIAEWKSCYLSILHKASAHMGGRPLVLKNPANTARIPLLLELFPNARFIHIHRNPYDTYRSSLHFYRKTIPVLQLQHTSAQAIEDQMVLAYQSMMRQFLLDRGRIPPGQLVEMRYEDLEARPIDELRRVYAALGLAWSAQVEAAMREYLAGHAHYRKNQPVIDAHITGQVNRYWEFALRAWGYEQREPAELAARAA